MKSVALRSNLLGTKEAFGFQTITVGVTKSRRDDNVESNGNRLGEENPYPLQIYTVTEGADNPFTECLNFSLCECLQKYRGRGRM